MVARRASAAVIAHAALAGGAPATLQPQSDTSIGLKTPTFVPFNVRDELEGYPPDCTPKGGDAFQYAPVGYDGIKCCEGLVTCVEPRQPGYPGYGEPGLDGVFVCREPENCAHQTTLPTVNASSPVAPPGSPPPYYDAFPVPTPEPGKFLTGENACEGHGYNMLQCAEVGCCQYWFGVCESGIARGECRSNVDVSKDAACKTQPFAVLQVARPPCDGPLPVPTPAPVGCNPTPTPTPPTPTPTLGPEICEGHDYSFEECADQPCCQFVQGMCPEGMGAGECRSNVGPDGFCEKREFRMSMVHQVSCDDPLPPAPPEEPCPVIEMTPTPTPTPTPLPSAAGTCEGHGYTYEQCAEIGCCQFVQGQCPGNKPGKSECRANAGSDGLCEPTPFKVSMVDQPDCNGPLPTPEEEPCAVSEPSPEPTQPTAPQLELTLTRNPPPSAAPSPEASTPPPATSPPPPHPDAAPPPVLTRVKHALLSEAVVRGDVAESASTFTPTRIAELEQTVARLLDITSYRVRVKVIKAKITPAMRKALNMPAQEDGASSSRLTITTAAASADDSSSLQELFETNIGATLDAVSSNLDLQVEQGPVHTHTSSEDPDPSPVPYPSRQR